MPRLRTPGLGSEDDSPNPKIGVRITLRRSELGRAVVVLALGTAALVSAFAGPASAAAPRQTAKHRSSQRAALLRALKRSPRLATKPSFLHKAALFGVDVPITIPPNTPADQAGTPTVSDDQIKVNLDPPPSDPALPTGVTPGIVSSTVDGGWTGTLRFSADIAGYGQPGVVELGFRQVALT